LLVGVAPGDPGAIAARDGAVCEEAAAAIEQDDVADRELRGVDVRDRQHVAGLDGGPHAPPVRSQPGAPEAMQHLAQHRRASPPMRVRQDVFRTRLH
jgi:hypothetical protein